MTEETEEPLVPVLLKKIEELENRVRELEAGEVTFIESDAVVVPERDIIDHTHCYAYNPRECVQGQYCLDCDLNQRKDAVVMADAGTPSTC